MKGCGSVTKRWVDDLLDKMTGGDHIKAVSQIRQVLHIWVKLFVCFYKTSGLSCFTWSMFTVCMTHILYFQKRNIMLKPDETKSNICDMQVPWYSSVSSHRVLVVLEFQRLTHFLFLLLFCFLFCFFIKMSDGTGLGESSSVLDFMSMKSYPDMSLDISMLNPLGDYSSSMLMYLHVL